MNEAPAEPQSPAHGLRRSEGQIPRLLTLNRLGVELFLNAFPFSLVYDVCVWYSFIMKIFMYIHHTLHRPKTKAETITKMLLGFVILICVCMLLILSIAGFLYAHSARPAMIAWGSAVLICILLFPIIKDISHAYIEVSDQDVLVVTFGYPFALRREKHVRMQDIARAEITRSKRYGGRLAWAMPPFISFYDDSERFLFEESLKNFLIEQKNIQNHSFY